MEKMCVSSAECDGNSTNRVISAGNELFYTENNGSECHLYNTETIPKQTDFETSYEEYIPSYQIVRDSNRFSEGSEENECILPISPVITPPNIPRSGNYTNLQVPFVDSVGKIVNENAGSDDTLLENDVSLVFNDETNETIKVDDGLVLLDKDISWESSMETPAPTFEHLDEYNTIERATLLPEKDLNNMQPRALFSPPKIDDSECLPLKYSSESEDEKCNYLIDKPSSGTCGSSVRSDGVKVLKDSTKKDPRIKNNQSPGDNQIKGTCLENLTLSPISPIINVMKQKKKPKCKKRQQLLVRSPQSPHDNNTGTSGSDKIVEEEKKVAKTPEGSVKMPITDMDEKIKNSSSSFNDNSYSIQDDSFQNMSFSYIDELCKSSMASINCDSSSNIEHSAVCKPNSPKNEAIQKISIKNLTPIKENPAPGKCFYNDTCRNNKLQPVQSLDDFLQSARKLEEEGDILFDKKPCGAFTNSELKVFNEMLCDAPESELNCQEIKTIQSRSSPKKPTSPRNELMKLDNEREELLIEGNKERTKMEEQMQDLMEEVSDHCYNSFNNISESDSKKVPGESNKKPGVKNGHSCDNLFKSKHDNQMIIENSDVHKSVNLPLHVQKKENDETCPSFSAAASKMFEGLNESHLNTKESLGNEPEESIMTKSDEVEKEFKGFKTASGAAVNISKESLYKAKQLFMEMDACEKNTEPEDINKFVGFKTASGSKIEISKKSLQTAKKVLSDFDFNVPSHTNQDFSEWADVSGQEGNAVGFKTASSKPVQISKKSLKKAKALWKQEEEIPVECPDGEVQRSKDSDILTDKSALDKQEATGSNPTASSEVSSSDKPQLQVFGFSTASGRNIDVSEKALIKGKAILRENEQAMDCGIEEGNGGKLDVIAVAVKENDPVDDSSKADSSEGSELVPSWLHAYYSTPTLTSSLAVMETDDSVDNSKPREAYVINSPILATTDRFSNKRKRKPGRKLEFNSPKEQKLRKNASNRNFVAPRDGSVKKPSIKRNLSDLGSDFSVPFKKRKVRQRHNVEYDLSEEVLQKRKQARLEQAKAGKKVKVNPIKGSHLLKKEEKQMSWCQAVNGAFPQRLDDETLKRKYGLRDDVLRLTGNNASSYRFKATHFYALSDCLSNVEGFPVGDGSLLIFDDDNMAGVEEFTRSFFASPGVEPKLISEEWIRNHYKWIVWKFSRYERNFPHVFGGRCLTPHNVMLQLKYRYDREIDASQRSALKKVLERDESSTKRMVLCVFDMRKVSDLSNKMAELSANKTLMSYELGLTDGWYGCYAQTDCAMTNLIEETKVTVGTKLITHGAELLSCNEALSPLEISDKPYLKVNTNSTRRAKWDSKLGFQKNGGPLLVSLSSIVPNGGLIGRVDIVVVRIYPLLFMEKKSDGTHVLRNVRTEDKAAAEYQRKQEAAIEEIYQRVNDEVKNEGKEKGKIGLKISLSDVSKISDPEELYSLYESCSDPSSFQGFLSNEQKEFIIDYQRRRDDMRNRKLSERVQEKIKTEKMNVRKVSQLLKVKIVDLHKPDYSNPVLYTVWNSTEDFSRLFSEGKALSLFNVLPGNSRFTQLAQINSTRLTQYREINRRIEYPSRRLSHLKELTLEYEPVFNELDIVGIVVYIHETSSYGSRLSQTVFLSDLEYNFVGIVFWDHCKDFGWENVLIVNSIVACSNLQWNRKRSCGGIPFVYVNDFSIFKENPKEIYMQEEMKRLKASLPIDMKEFVTKCRDEINAKLSEQKNWDLSRNMSNTNDSSNGSTASLKPKYINAFKTKPFASSTPFKDCSFGLDASGQEPSPIQTRIEKLQMYGEPPPISPLLPLVNLEKFNTRFKVPYKNVVNSSK